MKKTADDYIKPRTGSGPYMVRVTLEIDGYKKDVKRGPFATKGEARIAANQLLAEREKTRAKIKAGELLWPDAVANYFDWLKSESGYSGSTIQSYTTTISKYEPTWRNRITKEITRLDVENLIEQFCGSLTYEGKKSVVKAIRGVFERQMRLGKIQSNPCNGLYTKKFEKELIAMTMTEILKLFQEAKKVNHEWYLIWRVKYGLGLRSGEAFALKWSDISFEEETVTVSQSYESKSKKYKAPKNNKVRTIPLDPALKALMLEYKKKSFGDYVLPRPKEWLQGKAAAVLRQFQKDIGIRETNFHSLRASFITHLLNRGVPLTTVQKLVGHADLKTTQRYVRLTGSDLKGSTDVLSIDLSKLGGGE
jgi:site-specific recombinase XerD